MRVYSLQVGLPRSGEAGRAVRGQDRESAAAPALPDKPSIAVLPFANMSGDAEQEYFADGISEDIITALSKLPQLFVIARNSVVHLQGQERPYR